jgi:hypothetical protein
MRARRAVLDASRNGKRKCGGSLRCAPSAAFMGFGRDDGDRGLGVVGGGGGVGWVAEWGDLLVNHPKWGLTKVGE